MNKNFLQDVIPPNHKRSIKDIPLPKHKQSKVTRPVKKQEEEPIFVEQKEDIQHNYSNEPISEKTVFESEELHAHTDSDSRIEHTYQTSNPKPLFSKNKKRFGKKLAVLGVSIGIVGSMLVFLGKGNAEIIIKPNQSEYTINSAIPLDSPTSIATKTLISKTASRTVPATQDQQIEQSAQGKIKITNKHKEEPQELVTNTRFQAPNGLIYRIRQPIEIPGYKMVGGSMVPGTLEVEVYADTTGEEYNISNTTFTIPGFAGMEQFEKITAETVGEITGGYIGIRKVVSADTKSSIEGEIKQDLQKQIENLNTNSGEYVLVPDLGTLTYSSTKDEASGSSVTLTISASVSAYSIPKQELSDFIGQNTVPNATTEDSFVLNTETLRIVQEEDTLQISGQAIIASYIDVENIKNMIAGKKRSELVSMQEEFKKTFTILDMDLKPLARSFPSDTSKIKVTIAQ